jgi:kynurenine formamidase
MAILKGALRIVDLTLTIENKADFSMFPRHEIWGQGEMPTKIEVLPGEDWPIHWFQMSTESYTHVHVPRNLFEKGWSIEKVPVDYFVGDGVVFDMSDKKEREPIKAADFKRTKNDVKKGDIAIIRTGWTDRKWGTREFWVDMPYLAGDGCDWLIAKGVKGLVMDTYNDLPFSEKCRSCGKLHPKYQGSPNHYKFLKHNILLVEYATNLGGLRKKRVKLIYLPLKLKAVGQAPCRIIAIEE